MKNFCAVVALCAVSVAAQYGPSSQTVRMGDMYTASHQEQRSSGSSYGGGYSQEVRKEIPITSFNQEIRGSQSNNVKYETGNGISQSEDTQVVRGSGSYYDDGYGNQVKSDTTLKKQGDFVYTSPEGQRISTSWSADNGGFRAQGSHLPEPVPMPADHAAAHQEALSRVTSSSGSSNEMNSYSAPAPDVRQQSYSAPAPAPAMRQSYGAPASAPGVIRVQSY